MVERIAYRGRTDAQLASLSMDEYIKLVNARERRYIKRNPYTYRQLLEAIEKHRSANSKKAVRTHVREAVILPSWIGMSFEVHTGKEWVPVKITGSMLGHRLGEFAGTTKRVLHSAPGIRATRGSKFLSVK